MTKEEYFKVIELIRIHTEHNASYCDTGEDMEWACRSDCTEMAAKRFVDYFSPLLKLREEDNDGSNCM